MLSNLNIKLKSIVKYPRKIFSISSKLLVYAGLTIYWSVIILGTFIQIY